MAGSRVLTPKISVRVRAPHPVKRYRHTGGYIMLTLDNGRRVLEHRYVMEVVLGRKLLRGEVVHHRNKIRSDNRRENLELMTWKSHSTHHANEKPSREVVLRCKCGKEFSLRERTYKYRLKANSTISCSRRCGATKESPDMELLRQERSNGLSLQEIAVKYGYPKATVGYWLSKPV